MGSSLVILKFYRVYIGNFVALDSSSKVLWGIDVVTEIDWKEQRRERPNDMILFFWKQIMVWSHIKGIDFFKLDTFANTHHIKVNS